MCTNCFIESFLGTIYDDDMFDGRRGRRLGYSGPFEFGDGIDRDSFAPVSQRALNALENAKRIFLQQLATVDTCNGPVTAEIIKFHLVPDMRKAFNKYVRQYGCIAISRQLTRAEQDLVNKTRKSLIWYTSVKVTPEAQRAYLENNPKIAAKHATVRTAQAQNDNIATASGSGTASTCVAPSTQSQPLRETADVETQKIKHKLNEAAVKHASANPSIKKLTRLKA